VTTGHPGIERTKAIARSYVYWPNIDSDIKMMVNSCDNCAAAAKMPIKSPLHPWPAPTKVWDRLHIDYAGPVDGYYFLVVVDALSKWPEVIETKSISSQQTVKILSDIFARFGLPATIVSDDGTQFKSEHFANFMQENRIEHICTSPYHPMSNGQAERFVDSFKRALKKMEGEGTVIDNMQTFLQTYRSTTNSNVPDNKSPAEMMFGRPMRITLDHLKPRINNKQQISSNAAKTKQQFDRKHGTVVKEFQRCNTVYARVPNGPNHFKWVPGEIIEQRGAVMYNVRIANGRVIRSHINQLRRRYATEQVESEGKEEQWASALDIFEPSHVDANIVDPGIEDSNEHPEPESGNIDNQQVSTPVMRRSRRTHKSAHRYSPT